MIKWLQEHPQAGLLHYEQALRSPLSPMFVQYGRSFEDLERFARSPEAPHLEAWKHFNANVRDGGDVGIWHETYRVARGASESIFGNMPPRGLGVAGDLAPVGSTAATAATRIGARAVDQAPRGRLLSHDVGLVRAWLLGRSARSGLLRASERFVLLRAGVTPMPGGVTLELGALRAVGGLRLCRLFLHPAAMLDRLLSVLGRLLEDLLDRFVSVLLHAVSSVHPPRSSHRVYPVDRRAKPR